MIERIMDTISQEAKRLQHPHTVLTASCLFLAWVLFLSWQTFHPHQAPGPNLHPRVKASPPKQKQLNNQQLQQITQQHLFGIAPPRPSTIEQTTLQLSLIGILHNPQPEQSQAIISGPNGHEENYLVGDRLPGGAILRAIETNRVLLQHNNRIEALSLPHKPLQFLPAPQGLNHADHPNPP